MCRDSSNEAAAIEEDDGYATALVRPQKKSHGKERAHAPVQDDHSGLLSDDVDNTPLCRLVKKKNP